MTIQPRSAELFIRTVKLSKAILKQLRYIDRLPEDWIERDANGQLMLIKPEYVVGWFSGTVLGDEYAKFVLLKNGNGDYYLWGRGIMYPERRATSAKQLYIV